MQEFGNAVLVLEDHRLARVAAQPPLGMPGGDPIPLAGVGIGIGWPQQSAGMLGSTDECGAPAATERRLTSSLKTSPKAGTLWRSLLKSDFGIIKTFAALRARIVALRVRSESNAISPK